MKNTLSKKKIKWREDDGRCQHECHLHTMPKAYAADIKFSSALLAKESKLQVAH